MNLGLNIEDIRGSTNREKAIALTLYFYRRGDLDTLIHWASGKRGNIKWPTTKLDMIEDFNNDNN